MFKDVIIIGGGITGLHVLHELRLQGINATLLEKNAKIGGSWVYQMKDWQILQNTKKDFCMYGLCKRKYKKYMTKANMVDYIQNVANINRDCIQTNINVKTIYKVIIHTTTMTPQSYESRYSCRHSSEYLLPMTPSIRFSLYKK